MSPKGSGNISNGGLGERDSGVSWVKARDAAKHPTLLRTASHMPIVPKLRSPDLEEWFSKCRPLDIFKTPSGRLSETIFYSDPKVLFAFFTRLTFTPNLQKQ